MAVRGDRRVSFTLTGDSRSLVTALQSAGLEINKLRDQTERVGRRVEQAGEGFNRMERNLNSMRSTIQNVGSLFAFYFGAQLVRGIANASDAFIRFENSIKAVSDSTEEFNANQQKTFDVSQRTRSAFEQNARVFQRLSASADELGKSTDDVIRFQETVLKLGAVGGVGVREMQAGVIQLAQAMGSGVVAGDEFRSVMENLNPVARTVAENLGLTIGQLRALSRAQKLTSELFFDALVAGSDDADAAFSALTVTVEGAGTVLENSMTRGIAVLDRNIGFTDRLKESMLGLADVIDTLTEDGVEGLRNKFSELSRDIETTQFGTVSMEEAKILFADLSNEILDLEDKLKSIGPISQAAGDELASIVAVDNESQARALTAQITALAQAASQLFTDMSRAADAMEKADRAAEDFGNTARQMLQFQALATQEELAFGDIENVELSRAAINAIIARQRAMERLGQQIEQTRQRVQFYIADLQEEVRVSASGVQATRERTEMLKLERQAAQAAARGNQALAAVYRGAIPRVRELARELDELADARERNNQEMREFERLSQQEALAWGSTREFIEPVAVDLSEMIGMLDSWAQAFHRVGGEWGDLIASILTGLERLATFMESREIASFGELFSGFGQGALTPQTFGRALALGSLGVGIGRTSAQAFGGGSTAQGLFGIGSGALFAGLAGAGPWGIAAGAALGALPLLGDLFGGGNESSPQISIGGSATQTGRRAGTQVISPFGRFGLRNPRGADDFAELARVGQLIASTDRLINTMLTGGERAAVTGARAGFTIAMDSDDEREFAAAVNATFQNVLSALGPELGEAFGELTSNLRVPPEVGAQVAVALTELYRQYTDGVPILSDVGSAVEAANAIMDTFATSGQNLGEALGELAVAFDLLDAMGLESGTTAAAAFARELIDTAGSLDTVARQWTSYRNTFFTEQENILFALQAAGTTLQEEFGDIIGAYGITTDNFREVFERVRDSLSGADLATWLALAEQLGIIISLEEDLADARQDTADTTQDAIDADQDYRARLTDIIRESITLVDTLDDLGDSIRAIERGTVSMNQQYIEQQSNISGLIGGFDGTLTSLQNLTQGFQDYMSFVANMVSFIDNAISSINTTIDQLMLDIGLDLLPDDTARYEFLRERIRLTGLQLEQETDPQEILRLTNQIARDARRAWNLLTPEQQQAIGGDFMAWLRNLGITTTGNLQDVREMVIQNAQITADAVNVVADLVRVDHPTGPGNVRVDDQIPGAKAATESMTKASNAFNHWVTRFGQHVQADGAYRKQPIRVTIDPGKPKAVNG